MKDNQIQRQFIELRAQGWSYARIAGQLAVAKQTLINWSKRYQTEINNLRIIELEELQERHHMTKIARIQHLGRELQRVTEELAKRDFSAVPVEKLFEQVIKLLGQARIESQETQVFYGQADQNEILERLNRKVSWPA